VLVVAIGALAACVHYPTVAEVGGVQIRPANGRLVRQGDGAMLYADLHSTGKFGDTLTAARADVARDVRVVGADGAPVTAVDVPGSTIVLLRASGPHVQLRNLTRPLVPGETVVVTLTLAKIGHLGVLGVVE
jgi:copper(I)-binding protein